MPSPQKTGNAHPAKYPSSCVSPPKSSTGNSKPSNPGEYVSAGQDAAPNSGKTSSHNSNNANAKLSITPPAPSLCASTMEDAQKSQTQPQPLHKTYKQASSNPPLSQKKPSKNTSTNQTYQTSTSFSDHQANNEYPTSSSGKAPTPNSSS